MRGGACAVVGGTPAVVYEAWLDENERFALCVYEHISTESERTGRMFMDKCPFDRFVEFCFDNSTLSTAADDDATSVEFQPEEDQEQQNEFLLDDQKFAYG